jgi:hypothetical protein
MSRGVKRLSIFAAVVAALATWWRLAEQIPAAPDWWRVAWVMAAAGAAAAVVASGLVLLAGWVLEGFRGRR